jgi:hypothetical protein
MIIMIFAKSLHVNLIVTSVFVMFFGLILSLGSKASNQEILAATAGKCNETAMDMKMCEVIKLDRVRGRTCSVQLDIWSWWIEGGSVFMYDEISKVAPKIGRDGRAMLPYKVNIVPIVIPFQIYCKWISTQSSCECLLQMVLEPRWLERHAL